MTEQSYLNPTAIREQCALAVRHLEEDNESLRTAENSIACFAQAEELKGAAFGSAEAADRGLQGGVTGNPFRQ